MISYNDYKKCYMDMTPDQREVVDKKIYSVWTNPHLTDAMIRYIGFKLLELSIGDIFNKLENE